MRTSYLIALKRSGVRYRVTSFGSLKAVNWSGPLDRSRDINLSVAEASGSHKEADAASMGTKQTVWQ